MRRSTWFTLFALFAALCAAETAHAQTVQYFPQLVDGGGWVTTWYFTSLGAGPSVVTAEFFQQNGNPLILQTDRGTASTFTLNLAATGEVSLRTLGAPITVQVGWVKVTSSQPIGATEVFQFVVAGQVVSQAGVLPSDPTAMATVFVTINGRGRSTGMALANVGLSSNPVTFTLYNQSGSVVATSTLTLAPQGQLSRFINELPGFEQIGVIEGSLGISGLARFSVVTLVLDGVQLSTLPTLPGRVAGRTSNTVTVTAVADVTLAGMPPGFSNGSTSVSLNSPVESGLSIIPGRSIAISTSGTVTVHSPCFGAAFEAGPGGNGFGYALWLSDNCSSERFAGLPDNGISDLRSPVGALVGVFLGPAQPIPPRPPRLDFSGGAKDIVRIEPILNQSFYIGTGKTSQGQTKQFIVPDGATRLFLAVFDLAGATNANAGSFTVNLSFSQ